MSAPRWLSIEAEGDLALRSSRPRFVGSLYTPNAEHHRPDYGCLRPWPLGDRRKRLHVGTWRRRRPNAATRFFEAKTMLRILSSSATPFSDSVCKSYGNFRSRFVLSL